MSRFLCLNLQDFGPGQDITNIIQCSNLLCICCLDKTGPFIKLPSCKHTGFLENFRKIKIEQADQVVCYQCHATLKKIELFREQIEHSFCLLSSQLPADIQSNNLKKIKLERKLLDSLDINILNQSEWPLSQNHEIPIPKSKEDFCKLSKVEIKTEENTSNDELDYDIPLVYIKEEQHKTDEKIKKPNKIITKKKILKKRKTTVTKIKKIQLNELQGKENKYEGKINIILLTEEEMRAERVKNASNVKYLQLQFRCESCIVGFNYENAIKEHNEKKHKQNNGSFICSICQSVMTTDASYKDHMRRHYRRYECVKCMKRYNNMYPIIKHYNDMHDKIDNTLYKCAHCDFVSDNNRSYRYHIEKHKGKRQCAECGKTFVNSDGLKSHINAAHAAAGAVSSCGACGKQYRSRAGLLAHCRAAHPPAPAPALAPPALAPPAYCADCGTHFKSRHIYMMHLKTHSRHRTDADAKYQCDECGAKFVQKGQLSSHINFKHLNNTKYKCVPCNNRSFRNKYDLTCHVNRVHIKKPLPRNKICDYCGRAFTCTSILRTHIRTHTGARPLLCAHCPATFAHPAARYTHTRLLHAHAAATRATPATRD